MAEATSRPSVRLRETPDGRVVQVLPDGREIPYAIREPDHARLDAMTDEDIDRQIAEDPDVAEDMSAVPPEQLRRPGRLDVRAIRESLGMSQRDFAATFGVSLGTLRNWEQRRCRPDGAAQTLLTILKHDPEAAIAALRREVA